MSSPLPRAVFLNGKIVAAARARTSVFDRGLLYGDGLFETLHAYRGRVFALAEHLRRLQASAEFLRIPVPRVDWERALSRLLAANGLRDADAWVRVVLTRGVGAPALLPPARPRPTVLAIAGRIGPAIARARRRGAKVLLLPYAHTGFLSEHKVLDYLPAMLGKELAARHGAYEGLYVDDRGCVTEGTTSNVFVLRRGSLLTPPVAGILPGVTRRVVLQVAHAAGLRPREEMLTAAKLCAADEVFLTSSLAEVVPVNQVDERPIGGGTPGPLTRRLQELYRQAVQEALAG